MAKSANHELANLFEEIANYYKITPNGQNQYKERIYRNASDHIRNYHEPITSGESLSGIKGIGESVVHDIDEYLTTGKIARLEDLKKLHPDSKVIEKFTSIEGVGPAAATKFYEEGYRTIEELKSRKRLTKAQKVGIEWYSDLQEEIPRNVMNQIKNKINSVFKEYPIKWQITGSYRREKPQSGDIDLLIEDRPDLNMEGVYYLLQDYLPATFSLGPTKYMGVFQLTPNSIGHHIDIRLIEPENWAFALLYFTGSKQFNIQMRQYAKDKGFKLSEYGLYDDKYVNYPATTEVEIFKTLGLKYVKPSDRDTFKFN